MDVPTTDPVVQVSPDLTVAVTWRIGPDGPRIRLWNVAIGRPTIPEIALLGDAGVSFSPDGKTIVSSIQGRKIRLWDTTTGDPLGAAHEQPDEINSSTFSPDSKAILFGGKGGGAWIWDVPRATLRGMIPTQRGEVDAVGWSPDGRTFATGLAIAEVQVWDAATFAPLGNP